MRFSLPVLQRGLAKTKIRKTHFCRKPFSPPGLEALKENPPKKKTMIGSHFLPFFGAGLGGENVLGQNSDAQVGPSLFFLCLIRRPLPFFLRFFFLRVAVWKNFREQTFVFGRRCWSCVFFGGVLPRFLLYKLAFRSTSGFCFWLRSCGGSVDLGGLSPGPSPKWGSRGGRRLWSRSV